MDDFIGYERKRNKRMIEIRVLKAHQGDCIWVRCISKKVINIIIDAGPSTFKNNFINLIEEIEKNKEKIDLLVFSHIDDDHIKGCIKYLKGMKNKIIDKVWINGNGSKIYSDMQDHSASNVLSLVDLIKKNDIQIETPILEGDEFIFDGGKIEVIEPTESEMMKVATKIENSNNIIREHAGYTYTGNISETKDEYHKDLSDTNNASIIMVVEFENKKLLFTGDSTSENIIRAVEKYYIDTVFDIVKLPHHGSPHNVSRKLINKVKARKFIVCTNKPLEKVVLLRLVEERKTTEILCNYKWWESEYFTEDDEKKFVSTKKIIMKYIGEEKIILQ